MCRVAREMCRVAREMCRVAREMCRPRDVSPEKRVAQETCRNVSHKKCVARETCRPAIHRITNTIFSPVSLTGVIWCNLNLQKKEEKHLLEIQAYCRLNIDVIKALIVLNNIGITA
jgi:hypothetical protein